MAEEAKAKADDVVYVGCKVPMGVNLNLRKYEVLDERMGIVRRTGEDKATVTLRGNAYREDKGVPTFVMDGMVFTPVPKDFWDAWLKEHASCSLLADGYIVEAGHANSRKSVAKEMAEEPGMFPRLLQEGDPRAKDAKIKAFETEDA